MATRIRHGLWGVVVLSAVAPALLVEAGCTKRVVRERGIYSVEQLPEETQTPIFDAVSEPLDDDDKRK